MRPPVWPSVFTNIKTPLKNRVGNKFRKLQPINPVGRRSLVEFGCMERYSFILLNHFSTVVYKHKTQLVSSAVLINDILLKPQNMIVQIYLRS